MPGIGGPGQPVGNGHPDIQVVYQPLVAAETGQLVPGHEFDPDSDPEEGPIEDEEMAELEGDSDGALPASFEDQVLDEMHDRIVELEDRVLELESQLLDRQEALNQSETAKQLLAHRNIELDQKLTQSEKQCGELEIEKGILNERLKEETAEGRVMEEAWIKAAHHVDIMEREVRSYKVKMDNMSYAFRTAFGRTHDRIYGYPVEYGQPWGTMTRSLMIDILGQEYDDAIWRGMLP